MRIKRCVKTNVEVDDWRILFEVIEIIGNGGNERAVGRSELDIITAFRCGSGR